MSSTIRYRIGNNVQGFFSRSHDPVHRGFSKAFAGRVGLGQKVVETSRVGSGRVGSGRVGSGQVKRFSDLTGRFGSGRVILNQFGPREAIRPGKNSGNMH